MITENTIINKYLKKLTFNNINTLGLNDDVYYDIKKKLVFSTDTYEENIHFLDFKNPKNFTKKIFRSAVSDIISKGGNPIVYFLSLSLKKLNNNWLKSFTSELSSDSKKYHVFLGGGDTVKSKKNSISISVIGYIKKKPILRKNAKIGDDIYITGDLGSSYLGLLVKSKKKSFGKYNKLFVKNYLKPDLPFKFSKKLINFANSSMDISDGLIKDLKSLCYASKCGAQVNYNKLPFSKAAKILANNKKVNLKNIFSKGDDYQILFTASKKKRNLINTSAKQSSTKVTRVGVITTKKNDKIDNLVEILDLTSNKIGYIHKF